MGEKYAFLINYQWIILFFSSGTQLDLRATEIYMVIYMSVKKHEIEILAPAGNIDSLKSALKAGADAVYLGLTSLNARRGAVNFEPEKLSEIVALSHESNTSVYLTLNIDLTDREVGQAFRIVELASQAGVDAILVRDPALLFLPQF